MSKTNVAEQQIISSKGFWLMIGIAFLVLGCSPKGQNSVTMEGQSSLSMDIQSQTKAQVIIGNQQFDVELADTNPKRQRGLMFRKDIAENEGMLFTFERNGYHPFWMKNTLIDLDVIWISEERKIVDVQTLHPCTTSPDCRSFVPKDMAKYVLEVKGGTFRGKIGDKVEITESL